MVEGTNEICFKELMGVAEFKMNARGRIYFLLPLLGSSRYTLKL